MNNNTKEKKCKSKKQRVVLVCFVLFRTNLRNAEYGIYAIRRNHIKGKSLFDSSNSDVSTFPHLYGNVYNFL